MRTRPLYDVVALLARIGVGVVFMAHGWQKIEIGITATGRTFDDQGVPLPTVAAVYAAFAELLGGAALIVGLGLPIAGGLLFLDMVGAFVFVHAGEGLLVAEGGTFRGGYELVLVLGLAALVFATGGGGRLTLDRRLFGRREPDLDHQAETVPGELNPALERAEEPEPKQRRGRRRKSAPEDKSVVEAMRDAGEALPNTGEALPNTGEARENPSVTAPDPFPAPTVAESGAKPRSDGTEDDTLVAPRKPRRRSPGTGD